MIKVYTPSVKYSEKNKTELSKKQDFLISLTQYGKRIIVDDNLIVATGTTKTIYTVVQGKTFFLISSQFTQIGSSGFGYLQVNGTEDLLQTFTASEKKETYTPLLIFRNNEYFNIKRTQLTDDFYAILIGYEIDSSLIPTFF